MDKRGKIRYDRMKITIVYDNRLARAGLKKGWGFAALIEAENTPPLLFDTGDDGASLLYNMEQLGIDPDRIGIIVISHAHGDHTGGLSDLLQVNSHARLYLPASISIRNTGLDVAAVSGPVNISETVISTGELKRIEQSLAVRTGKGIVVVTGCSHPGVGDILDAAARYGTLYGIVGGFHGFSDFHRLNGLSLICPCHCTQHIQEIKDVFPEQYTACGAGLTLEI
jgi:7,8-dihydropterin-6-yl-methyl-4-(beta-D-ribofuranosyl)aminobenzene 5'-phosphate synthase